MIKVPTAFISGVIPRRIVDQIYMGKVLSRPVRKNATGISSKDTVKARRPLPITAEHMLGNVTRKKVCQTLTPRSLHASSKERPTR